MNGPDPMNPRPMKDFPDIGFLKPLVKSPRIEVGDYTYLHEPEGPENFEKNNVLYHFDFVGDRLVIGKYCSLARGIRFIMNGANHPMGGYTAYPFFIFGRGWEQEEPLKRQTKGNTVVGNDVWIGYESVIMPGVRIGDGAIVAARSVVTRDVEPYTVVAGNPARPIRKRFDDEVIERLLQIRWWDWPPEKVTIHRERLLRGDAEWLRTI